MKLSDLIMNLMPDNNDQPEVIIAKPRFPLPPKVPLILGGTILLFIAGLVLFQKFYPQPVPMSFGWIFPNRSNIT